MKESTRAWIYRVLTAVSLLVVFYGLATDAEAALWLGVINAVLGNGLATMNTSTDSEAGGADWPTIIVAAAVAVLVYIVLAFVIFDDEAGAAVLGLLT